MTASDTRLFVQTFFSPPSPSDFPEFPGQAVERAETSSCQWIVDYHLGNSVSFLHWPIFNCSVGYNTDSQISVKP